MQMTHRIALFMHFDFDLPVSELEDPWNDADSELLAANETAQRSHKNGKIINVNVK